MDIHFSEDFMREDNLRTLVVSHSCGKAYLQEMLTFRHLAMGNSSRQWHISVFHIGSHLCSY